MYEGDKAVCAVCGGQNCVCTVQGGRAVCAVCGGQGYVCTVQGTELCVWCVGERCMKCPGDTAVCAMCK